MRRRRRRRTDADDEPIWGIQNTARAHTTIIVIAYRESRRTNDMIHQTRLAESFARRLLS